MGKKQSKQSKRFTTTITGKNEDGSRYKDKYNVVAPDRKTARAVIETTRLPGERIVYTGPGEDGHRIRPLDG